eukprot:10804771-Ditylum_brightwellii.AAC.1
MPCPPETGVKTIQHHMDMTTGHPDVSHKGCHPRLVRQLKLWEGQEPGPWQNSSVKRCCSQTDESSYQWSPLERLLK